MYHLLQQGTAQGFPLNLVDEVLSELLQGREGPVGAQVGAVEFSVFLAVLDDAEDTVAGWRPCGEYGRGISLIAVIDKSYQGDFFSLH